MARVIDVSSDNQPHDRSEMLKAFDQTQAGVKGLVDFGVVKVPRIFVRPSDELAKDDKNMQKIDDQIPVIDVSGIHQDPNKRKEVIEQVRVASGTWGFFQVVNHGIPQNVVDGVIDGVNRFHELDLEEKKRYFTRDATRRVRFISNYDLFTSRTANWRDTLLFSFPDHIDSKELPASCRENTIEYLKHVSPFANTLLEILSEGLGLKPDHLKKMECLQGIQMSGHYYPACPEPELAIGTTTHSDPGFLTILLQNQISGLQILYKDEWVDVQPVHGGLIINIGDLLQLVSNGKYISVKHRVLANCMGPRISVAIFYSGPMNPVKRYCPITELISEENPAKYREVVLGEYTQKFVNAGLDEYAALDYYKL